MRKFLFCFILFFSCLIQSNAQELIGKYFNAQEFIFFKPNNNVEFSLNSRTCLSSDYKGRGKFEIKNNFLKIEVEEIPNQRPQFEKIKCQSIFDTITVYVYSDKNKPIENASVILSLNKNLIVGTNTKNGIAKLFYNGKLEGLRLSVNYVGLQSFSQSLTDNDRNDYNVYLSENPNFDQTKAFLNDAGSGFEFKVENTTLFLKRKKHICVRTDKSDDSYEWIKFNKSE